MASGNTAAVLELRVALTTRDYERLVSFYCDALGLEPAQRWTDDREGHGMMLEMGQGTLELFNEAYASGVDQIEAGERTSGAVRLALRVPDLQAALARALAKGATLVHEPVVTPWGDRNVRLQDPDGLQITLFEAPQAP
jgi:catechol 2,3-dioxygenase-like lactoylglutathione lyase family enzyme